jgi:hypothetical protein
MSLRRVEEKGWELVPPRCAAEREDDLAEIHAMLEAGEVDIARDELRWLLEECHDLLEAHRLLGELALADNDLPLARGHFGYAVRIGQGAIDRAGKKAPVPYLLPGNRAFLEAGKGLVWSLLQLEKRELAAEVAEQLMACDPSDPLGLRRLVEGGGGSPDGSRIS